MTFLEKLKKKHPELADAIEYPPLADAVEHPAHYNAGGIECIEAIEAALACQSDPMQAFLTGQVLKYLWFWPLKGGVEDLEKARFYLERLIARAKRVAENTGNG